MFTLVHDFLRQTDKKMSNVAARKSLTLKKSKKAVLTNIRFLDSWYVFVHMRRLD